MSRCIGSGYTLINSDFGGRDNMRFTPITTVKIILNEYYQWIKDINNKVTLSQLTIQSNPKNHHDLIKRQAQ